MMDTMLQDLRYAFRALRKNPGFTAVAAVTLALGIGINTSIFSVVNGVILRPLPFPEPERLVTVWENMELRDGPVNEWTGRSTFADWRARNGSFDAMTAVTGWGPSLSLDGPPEVVQGGLVTPGYFRVLGVGMARGRGFLSEEELPGSELVAVITHELWQLRFGGEPDLLGQSVSLSGRPYTIVGILPPGFQAPILAGAQIFGTLIIDPADSDRGNYFLRVIGRISDQPLETVQADMALVAESIGREHPVDYRDVGVSLVPLRDLMVGPVRTPLFILLGAVGLILLIACANVANLLLARASVREREMAVRAALGAGRGRLVRQMLTESVVLAIMGGLLGLALAVWGTELLLRLAPPGLPRATEIGLHPTVFGFALGAAVVSGLLFGLAPALGLSGGRSAVVLREGGRGAPGRGANRLRGGLVAVELALGMTVLAAAGLLLKSFEELRSVDPGFRIDDTLSASIFMPGAGYPERENLLGFMAELETRLAALPGVRAAGAATVLPLGGNVLDISWGIEGRLPAPGEEPMADSWRATPGFFHALRIPLIRGRLFDETDRDGTTNAAIVSQSLVERHFTGEDPLGKRIKVGGVRDPDSPWWTIVGVVGTVRTRGLNVQPEAEIFVPFAQRPARFMSLVIHADGDAAALAPAVRDAVGAIDPEMPLANLDTLEDVFAASIAPQRFTSQLLGAFALLALILGGVGIYGVMAFMVSQRTREIGIRMAIGASAGSVRRSVLRRGALITATGVALGLVGAVAASRALASLLFNTSPLDPLILTGVTLLLAGTAMTACYLPALRATRVDPVKALRYE